MDKIIKFFILNPDKEFHIRQLSKLVKKSPTTISKYLKEQEKKGILKSDKKLNHLFFRANSEGKKFKLIKLNYNLWNLYETGLIDFLIKEFNHPKTIVLFGSYSRGEDSSNSDIDLFIVSSLKKHPSLDKFEKKLNREIQLIVKSSEEVKKMKNKELLNNVINGIILSGFLEVL